MVCACAFMEEKTIKPTQSKNAERERERDFTQVLGEMQDHRISFRFLVWGRITSGIRHENSVTLLYTCHITKEKIFGNHRYKFSAMK